MVHVRKLGERVLDFGVSGSLWNDALVMYDRQTRSLWTHVTGRCIEGVLAGARLSMLPATLTTFQEWVVQHPTTLVLAKGAGEERGSKYLDYVPSEMQGIFGTRAKRAELAPKEIVQGIAIDGEAAAIPVAACREGVPIRFDLKEMPLVALKSEGVVKIYERRSGDDVSSLGKEAPSTTAYWFAWLNFYPKSRIIR